MSSFKFIENCGIKLWQASHSQKFVAINCGKLQLTGNRGKIHTYRHFPTRCWVVDPYSQGSIFECPAPNVIDKEMHVWMHLSAQVRGLHIKGSRWGQEQHVSCRQLLCPIVEPTLVISLTRCLLFWAQYSRFPLTSLAYAVVC